jgi:putative ABC transport system permease protein
MDEVRLAVRRLKSRPGAMLFSVLTLACAIGASASTWSLLSAVVLHPLPVRNPARLVVAGTVIPAGSPAWAGVDGTIRDGFIYPLFPAIRDSGIFDRVVAEWGSTHSLLTGTGSTPVRAAVGFATFDFFEVLGIPMRSGRGFLPADDQKGAAPVAIVTDAYRRRTFGDEADVVGRTMTVASTVVTIVGVTPRGFRGTDLSQAVDFYLPLHTLGEIGSPLTNYFADPAHSSAPTSGVKVIALLRAGTTPSEATARLAGLDVPPNAGKPALFGLTPIEISAIPVTARAGMNQFAGLLAATVSLLLLIGCGTVGMLLLVRTEARRDEFALCVALGASRTRLAAGIAAEGTLLACIGAVLAIPIAWWLFYGVRAFRLPGAVDIGLLDLTIDLRAIAAASGGALLACVVISLIAATYGFGANAAESLRSRTGATPRLRGRATRSVLVAAQVAVALVLVAGAVLFARSLSAALSLNTGLEMRRVVTGSVDLGPHGYDAPRAGAFFDDVRGRLLGNPAVLSMAYSVEQGGMSGKLVVDGEPRQFPTMVAFMAVDDEYFRTLGVHVFSGRDFTQADRPGAPLVTLISESFARQLAGSGNPIGRRVTMPGHRPGQPPDVMEVVGVVSDVVTRVSVLEPLTMYFPLAQTGATTYRSLAIRAARDADAARREIMSAIKQVDAAVAPSPLITLEGRIAQQMGSQRFGAVVLGALGGVAVLLTILGTYVLAESMAAMRMREMGIRAALGASGRQLGVIVLAETGRLVGLGLIVGFALAWVGAGTIRAFLFQIKPLDPATLAEVAGLIFTLALAVSLRPAIRASRVDPAQVLKEP